MGAPMRLLNLSGWSIKRMLRLEEALLRHEGGNWCLVNALPAGSKTHPTAPTVVVGLSGKPELLLDEAKLRGADDAPCEPFPRDIMAWTEGVYADAFGSVLKPGAAFSLRADDYVLGGDRKGRRRAALHVEAATREAGA
ncbi:lipoate-protein ligase [Aureococcus anophagefferens]|nr:lipoate-protein ligase [Aureococcus anophagefferens]